MKPLIEDAKLRKALEKICRQVADAGGRALLVGGCVRDTAMEVPAKDLDIEVRGVAPGDLKKLLRKDFALDLVGESFGVLKIRGLAIDVSIPRRESKAGTGHRGFDVDSDPDLPVRDAAARRDFTVNSIALDPLRGEILDPFDGLKDLKAKVLRHTSEKFAEDPLRVLRGMQFAARFDLTPAKETIELCRKLTLEGLARERMLEEWKKLILSGVKPSKGLSLLKDCDWIRYYPELKALVGCEQEAEWHPEGDVWEHTLACLDFFASERIGDEWEDLVVGFAVACHDFGKPATTKFQEGRIRSRGHDEAGVEPTRTFLERLTNQEDLIEAVIPLVRCHLRPLDLFRQKAGDAAIRRLARRVGRIDRLVRVARADRVGTQRDDDGFPAGKWLMERAEELDVADAEPRALVLGRHLLPLGVKPGPLVGKVLKVCYEAQIEGTFTTLEQGIEFAKRELERQGFELKKSD